MGLHTEVSQAYTHTKKPAMVGKKGLQLKMDIKKVRTKFAVI